MKRVYLAVFAILASAALPVMPSRAEDATLVINGQKFYVNLDAAVTLEDGTVWSAMTLRSKKVPRPVVGTLLLNCNQGTAKITVPELQFEKISPVQGLGIIEAAYAYECPVTKPMEMKK